MRQKTKTLTPIKDVIANLLEGTNLPFNPDDARIWEVWNDSVGEAVANHARPAYIKKGLLRVEVTDPIWLQELIFARENIMQKLNENMGREAVSTIEFRLGPL